MGWEIAKVEKKSTIEKTFSCEDVAERYGVKKITVWDWIRKGKLNAIKTGKIYRIRATDLEEFENARNTKSAG
jgi:excisionase family DNA binding protein